MSRVYFERIEKCLESLEEVKRVPWEERERRIIELQSVFLRGGDNFESFPSELLKKFRRPLEAQIRDLRSAIVREACKLIVVCSDTLGSQFSKVATHLLAALLDLIACGNKVIVSYVDQCCDHLFRTMRLTNALPKLLYHLLNNKSKETRESCVSYLWVILDKWNTKTLGKFQHDIEDTIGHILRDASSMVRSRARDCFIRFEDHFPSEAMSLLHRTDERTQRALFKALDAKHERFKNGEFSGSQTHGDWSSPSDLSHVQSKCAQTAKPSLFSSGSSSYLKVYEEEKEDTFAHVTERSRKPSKWGTVVEPEKNMHIPPPVGHTNAKLPQAWDDDFASVHKNSPKNSPSLSAARSSPPPRNAQGEFSRLVTAHRVHLNELIKNMSEELTMLKQFEKRLKGLGPDIEEMDKQDYIYQLDCCLNVKEDGIAKIRAEMLKYM